MSFLIDRCIFNASSGGTGTFVVASAVLGYMTPAQAKVVNGVTYSYAAQSIDLSQWEVGRGIYTATGTMLTRTVLFNSLGNTSAVNFTLPPRVMITALADDFRIILTQDTTFWVDPVNGNDGNSGLSQTNAFKTPQGAWNAIVGTYDGGGHNVTLKLLPGTYNAATSPFGYQIQFSTTVGINTFNIESSTLVASDVVLDCPAPAQGNFANFTPQGAVIIVFNCTFTCSDGSGNVYCDMESPINFTAQGCVLGALGATGAMGFSDGVGTFLSLNHCTATGGAGYFLQVENRAEGVHSSTTLTGTPNFVQAFNWVDNNSYLIANPVTGAATGARYKATAGSIINVAAGNLLSQPGNSIGTIDDTSTVIYKGGDNLLHRYTTVFQGTLSALNTAIATPYVGQEARITDSSTGAWGAVIAGGGAFGAVFGKWNGTNWTVSAL